MFLNVIGISTHSITSNTINMLGLFLNCILGIQLLPSISTKMCNWCLNLTISKTDLPTLTQNCFFSDLHPISNDSLNLSLLRPNFRAILDSFFPSHHSHVSLYPVYQEILSYLFSKHIKKMITSQHIQHCDPVLIHHKPWLGLF